MSKLSSLDMWSVTKYVRAVANEAGLNIVWEDKFMPRTDGRNIWLPRVQANMTQAHANRLMYSADHECSHVIYSKFVKDEGLSATTSFLGAIINCLEDNRIDFKTGTLYEGSRIIGDEVVSISFQEIAETIEKKIKEKNPETTKNMEAIGSLISWAGQARDDYHHLVAQEGRTMRPIVQKISADADKYLQRLEDGDYTAKLKEISNKWQNKDEAHTEIVALASRIYEEVYEQDAEQEKERCKQLAKQKAQSGEGDSDEVGEEGSGEEDDGEGKKRKISNKFQNVKWKAVVPDNHDKYNLHSPGGGQHIDYSDYAVGLRDAYVPSIEKTIEIDYRKHTHKNIDAHTGDQLLASTNQHLKEAVQKQLHEHASTEGFANKVRQLLQIRAKARTQYGVKSGKLHAGNINRVTLKNAGAYGERIFKKKEEKDLLNISISIVCDMSGSMSGSKMINATVASMLLNHTLGNVLHIPVELLGFSVYDNENMMYIWRDFSDKLVANEHIVDYMIAATKGMNSNQDGDAILYAYERIRKQKTRRKLLIVLSDGSPACGKPGDDVAFLKDTVQRIEQHKSGVEIVGIGICDENVKRFYKENYIINDSSELERALLTLIDKKLTV